MALDLKWLGAWLEPIESFEIVQDFAASGFWYPLVESVHVIGVSFLVGTILFLDLRLMGFSRAAGTVSGAARVLPLAWGGFLVAAVTGAVLFAPQASRYVINPAFQIKFALMAAAGLNMAIFHFGIWRSVKTWDEAPPPAPARLSGLLSALFWMGAVFYGRLVPFLT